MQLPETSTFRAKALYTTTSEGYCYFRILNSIFPLLFLQKGPLLFCKGHVQPFIKASIAGIITFITLQLNVFQSCGASKDVRPDTMPARSCLDLLRKGVKTSGHYKIYDCTNDCFTNVYCHMECEPGAAWTLIESFALKNKGTAALRNHQLSANSPINEKTPINWNIYRMSLSQMNALKPHSTHWRVTCSLPTHGVDYRDYARANFVDFDIMAFTGSGVCKKMELVNIRGHQCAQCTAMWWHINAHPAMDS